MKEINKQIKNGDLKQVYLLYGEEEYLKKIYKKKLKEAVVGIEDTMNYNCFQGANIGFPEVIDIAETLPFFADRRLIIIEDSKLFKKANEEMLKYLETIPRTTFFIFVENEVDKRGKMFKRVKEEGYVCELGRQGEDILTKWVMSKLDAENKKISKEGIKYLLTNTGYSMENISNELEKLICYTMDRTVISEKEIEEICTAEITGKIFEMIDAISMKNKEKLFALYYDLLMVKEPAMRIIYLLQRQFNLMMQVKELLQKGFGKEVIREKLKMQSFVVNKMINQIKNFSENMLSEALEDLISMEESIKTGKLEDKIGIELFFIKYS